MITRRDFLKLGAAAGTVAMAPSAVAGMLLAPWRTRGDARASVLVPQIPLSGRSVPKYVDPLPTFVGNRVQGTSLTVSMSEFRQQVLPAGFGQTTVWGYTINDGVRTFGPLFPGFTVEARRGVPTNVQYVNNLVGTQLQRFLTVDQTLHWADPLMQHPSFQPYTGPVPAVAHLHGGEVPSAFDGGPDEWFTPGNRGQRLTGPGFVTDSYTYPNAQEATTLWFHDHALGATRLNVYAGLAAFYFLRDNRDTGLPGNPIGLPAGEQEVEIVIQGRMFDTEGRWFYPDVGVNPSVHPFWQPEFFGDVIVVNGKSWPYLEVEPRRYRFRFLNGSNARVYELRVDGGTLPFWQIGTDGGLLETPVMVDRLVIAPGERADVIVDFTGRDGQTLLMTNSGKAPYPSGTPADPQTVGQIMQFRVNRPLSGTDTTLNPAAGGALRPSIVRLANGGALAPGVVPDATRLLTLNEVMGPNGPLEALLNNSKWGAALSETPRVGSTEVWEIVNLTGDTHPIHTHLVQCQLINRQMYNVGQYTKAYEAAFPGGAFVPEAGPPMPYGSTAKLGGNPDVAPYLQGPPMPPAPNERGWKDTFQMNPGEVTRIVVRIAPQHVPIGGVSPGQNAFAFDPTAGLNVRRDRFGYPGGPGYVWHCHILEHEDNEMMRPLVISS